MEGHNREMPIGIHLRIFEVFSPRFALFEDPAHVGV